MTFLNPNINQTLGRPRRLRPGLLKVVAINGVDCLQFHPCINQAGGLQEWHGGR
ncbi:MAG: hypothetical protein ACI8TP_004170 [Acidimicrobiales bacterium]|jgi:hypothetical protein